MNFIDFGDGLVNLAHVQSIRQHWINKKGSITLIYTDGSTLKINGEHAYRIADELENLTASVIPAAPGFEMLRCWFWKEHEPSVEREPIIAWRVSRYSPQPVTLDEGPSYDTGIEAVLRPDGVVVDIGNCTWDDVKGWTAYVCKQWKKWCEKTKDDAAA